MPRILAILSSTIVLLSVSLGQSTAPKPAPTFIHCGTLIDGRSENVFFEIQDDKITAIPAAVPGSAKVIDLSNENLPDRHD